MRQQGVWYKSSRSNSNGTGGCVEVRVDVTNHEPEIRVRDTKDRSSGPLRFTGPEWDAFIAGVKQGEFDI